MGALAGSIAVRRYQLQEPLPDDLRKRFMRGLRAHPFLPIDPKSDLTRSVGWVSILDGEDFDLHPEKIFWEGEGGLSLRVTLRIDVLKPPASDVRRQVATRAAAIEAETGKPLTRRAKRELKEEVSRELRKRTLPRVKLTDLVWDLDGKRLYLWSQSKTVNETFLDLFVKTFALKIDVEGPSAWARHALPARVLSKLMPTPELWTGFSGVRPLSGSSDAGDEGDV